MKLSNPFAKKSLAERRAETAEKIAAAEQSASAAQDERLQLALAGEDTSAAERSAWELETRLGTLRTALAEFDRQIAAEEAAAAEAAHQDRIAKAALVRDQLADELAQLSADLAPLLERAAVVGKNGDFVVATYIVNGLPSWAAWPQALRVLSAYVKDSNVANDDLLERLERVDAVAKGLAQ